MNQDDITRTVNRIKNSYPNKPMTVHLEQEWKEYLADKDYGEYRILLKRYFATGVFMPKPVDLNALRKVPPSQSTGTGDKNNYTATGYFVLIESDSNLKANGRYYEIVLPGNSYLGEQGAHDWAREFFNSYPDVFKRCSFQVARMSIEDVRAWRRGLLDPVTTQTVDHVNFFN